jgi:hypothetical protein
MIDLTILPDLLQTLARQAEADGAPYREHAFPTTDILTTAAKFTEWRVPQDDTVDGEALRACYDLAFRCAAIPPGQWQSASLITHISSLQGACL